MSWVLAFVGFSLLIVFHELGHFAAAKAVGMRAERFMLFFGKPIVSVTRGETTYGIGTIPLGGYVKITGMDPREELDPEVAPRAYTNMPVWKRLVVIAAGPAVNVVIAFVLLVGIFAFSTLNTATPQVDEVARGTPAAESLRPGDRILSVDGVRVGTPGANALAVQREVGEARARISSTSCRGGAREAGCRATNPIDLRVERDGRARDLSVRPAFDREQGAMLLGFSFRQQQTSLGLLAAAPESLRLMREVTSTSLRVFSQLVYSQEAREQVSGPVGSYERTRQAFELSIPLALNFLALISLALAIVNLFPFLPLDGGHILWALVEKVRRKPVPFRWMERASIVGFALILALFALGLTNDLGAIFGEGITVQ